MSASARNWAYGLELTGWAKPVLVAIADYYHDKKGFAWPQQSSIAFKAGCSVRQARRAIKQLRDAGIIDTKTVRFQDKGKWITQTQYFLTGLTVHPEQSDRTDSPKVEDTQSYPLGHTGRTIAVTEPLPTVNSTSLDIDDDIEWLEAGCPEDETAEPVERSLVGMVVDLNEMRAEHSHALANDWSEEGKAVPRPDTDLVSCTEMARVAWEDVDDLEDDILH